MSNFNQGVPGVATLINSSATILSGNAASANALTVRQFGGGNVFSASNTAGTIGLFVSATSNVGVGTASPGTTLQVSGPANTAANRATPYANAFVSVTNDIMYGTTGQAGLEIGSGTRASGDQDRVYKYVFNAINNSSVGSGVDLQILAIPAAPASYASDGTARNRMVIRFDGNVGIGIANPTTILQLSSADGVDPRIVTGRTAARANGSEYTVAGLDAYFVTRDGVQNLGGFIRINDYNTNGTYPITIRGGRIVFGTVDGTSGASAQASERMTILANGNVGIGTASPGYTLDVNGTVNLTGLRVSGGVGGNSTGYGAYLRGSGTSGGVGWGAIQEFYYTAGTIPTGSWTNIVAQSTLGTAGIKNAFVHVRMFGAWWGTIQTIVDSGYAGYPNFVSNSPCYQSGFEVRFSGGYLQILQNSGGNAGMDIIITKIGW